MKKRQIPDSGEKILITLTKAFHGYSFSEIMNSTGLSKPVISMDLKILLKKEYIIKNFDNRKYKITDSGTAYLKKLVGIEGINNSSTSFTSVANATPGIYVVPNPIPLSIKSWGHPFTEEKVVIDGYFSLGTDHRDEAEMVLKQLQKNDLFYWLPDFFNGLGKAISDITFRSNNLFGKPEGFQKRIKEAKAALDFEASLLVLFNGKDVAEKIPWDELLADARALEKRVEEEKKLSKRAFRKNTNYRRLWLETYVLEQLPDHLPLLISQTGSTPAELETAFIKQVTSEKTAIPKDTSEGELRKIIEVLMKDGTLKIREITKYAFEVNKQKLSSKKDENYKLLRDEYAKLK
jgi:predicted transcriptional regulator